MPSIFMPSAKDEHRRMIWSNDCDINTFLSVFSPSKEWGEIGIISDSGFDYHCVEILNDQIHYIKSKRSKLRTDKINLIPYKYLDDFQVNIGLVITKEMTTEQIDNAINHIVYWKYTDLNAEDIVHYFELKSNTRTTLIMDEIDDDDFDGIAAFKTNLYWNESNIDESQNDIYSISLILGHPFQPQFLKNSHRYSSLTMTDLKQGYFSDLRFLIGNKLYTLENRKLLGDKKQIFLDEPYKLNYQTSDLCPNSNSYYGWEVGQTSQKYIIGIILKKVFVYSNPNKYNSFLDKRCFECLEKFKYGPSYTVKCSEDL